LTVLLSTSALQKYLGNVTETPVTVSDCKEVHEILMMFRRMDRALGNLNSEQQERLRDRYEVSFKGFDWQPNSGEERIAQYAEFVLQAGNYTESRAASGSDSHWPMLCTYQKMLGRLRALPPGDLSVRDMIWVGSVRL
jgi:uncharacterized protein YfbU (UPF0304 family)